VPDARAQGVELRLREGPEEETEYLDDRRQGAVGLDEEGTRQDEHDGSVARHDATNGEGVCLGDVVGVEQEEVRVAPTLD